MIDQFNLPPMHSFVAGFNMFYSERSSYSDDATTYIQLFTHPCSEKSEKNTEIQKSRNLKIKKDWQSEKPSIWKVWKAGVPWTLRRSIRVCSWMINDHCFQYRWHQLEGDGASSFRLQLGGLVSHPYRPGICVCICICILVSISIRISLYLYCMANSPPT